MRSLFICLPLFLIILTGCDKSADYWQAAKSEDTIEAYQDFIQKYPDSRLADSADFQIKMFEMYDKAVQENSLKSLKRFYLKYPPCRLVREAAEQIDKIGFDKAKRLNTFPAYRDYKTYAKNSVYRDSVKIMTEMLRELRHPSLRNLNTAAINIDYSVNGGNESNFKRSLSKLAESILICAGFKITDVEEKSDFTIVIKIRGDALKKAYSGQGSLYTGAEISGSISINVAGQVITTKKFNARENPPSALYRQPGQYEKPEDAPIGINLLEKPKSFEPAFLSIALSHFGYPSLVALIDDDYTISYSYEHASNGDYRSHFKYFKKLNDKDQTKVVDGLIMVLENNERNHNDIVYLLGDLKNKKALNAIINSASDWDIKQKAVYKITNKKFDYEDTLKLWYEKQTQD